MPFVFHDQPEPWHEARIALRQIRQGETIAKWLETVLEEYGDDIDSQALHANLEGLAELEAEVAAALPPPDDWIETLFRQREGLLSFDEAVFLRARAQALGKPCSRAYAILVGVQVDWGSDVKEEDVDEAAFMRWVDALEVEPQDRYDLLRLYIDFDRYAERAMEHVGIARGVVERRLPEFAPRLAQARGELEADIGPMQERLGLQFRDGETYDVYPTLMMPNGLSAHVNRDLGINALYVGVGLLRTMQLLEAARAKQDIPADFLKILADPTKMSILRKLKERRYYSAELAEALGLSTATISHHMAPMANKSFVTLEKEGNRVYYSLRRHTIRDGLRRIERALCDD